MYPYSQSPYFGDPWVTQQIRPLTPEEEEEVTPTPTPTPTPTKKRAALKGPFGIWSFPIINMLLEGALV